MQAVVAITPCLKPGLTVGGRFAPQAGRLVEKEVEVADGWSGIPLLPPMRPNPQSLRSRRRLASAYLAQNAPKKNLSSRDLSESSALPQLPSLRSSKQQQPRLHSEDESDHEVFLQESTVGLCVVMPGVHFLSRCSRPQEPLQGFHCRWSAHRNHPRTVGQSQGSTDQYDS